jgi:hypothetical protein
VLKNFTLSFAVFFGAFSSLGHAGEMDVQDPNSDSVYQQFYEKMHSASLNDAFDRYDRYLKQQADLQEQILAVTRSLQEKREIADKDAKAAARTLAKTAETHGSLDLEDIHKILMQPQKGCAVRSQDDWSLDFKDEHDTVHIPVRYLKSASYVFQRLQGKYIVAITESELIGDSAVDGWVHFEIQLDPVTQQVIYSHFIGPAPGSKLIRFLGSQHSVSCGNPVHRH